MQKVKYTLASIGASLALMLGLALPVGASSNDGPSRTPTNNNCVDYSCNNDNDTKNTDNSVTLGNCSINGSVNQHASSSTGNNDADADGGNGDDGGDVEKEGTGGSGGAGGAGGSATQHNSASASNSISQDCSTTNVTNAAATQQVLAASTTTQVQAPSGAVSAGAGGGATSSVATVLGMAGSVVTMSLGFVVRKFNV